MNSRLAFLVILTLINTGAAATIVVLVNRTDAVRDTLAFSCGYLYGMNSAVRHAKLPMSQMVPLPACEDLRGTAVKNGFDTAAEDAPGKQLNCLADCADWSLPVERAATLCPAPCAIR